LSAIQQVIVTWGHYVVLFFLMVETALYLSLNVSLKVQRAGVRTMAAS
jgi:hypothetical protein